MSFYYKYYNIGGNNRRRHIHGVRRRSPRRVRLQLQSEERLHHFLHLLLHILKRHQYWSLPAILGGSLGLHETHVPEPKSRELSIFRNIYSYWSLFFVFEENYYWMLYLYLEIRCLWCIRHFKIQNKIISMYLYIDSHSKIFDLLKNIHNI